MKKVLSVLFVLFIAFTFFTITAGAEEDFKVGLILVHDENSGYDMAHIDGMKAAQQALGLRDDQIIYKYNIPETEACYDNAVDLAEQGCKLIISNSYGHQSYMMQAAAEYPLEGWPIRTRRDRRCTPSWQRIRATCQRDESSGTAEKICAP